MSRFIDLTGLKFSHLTVLGQAGRDKFGRAKWLCECDCPEKNQIITWSTNLRTGNTESCGCVTRSQRGLSSHDALYDTYRGIIRRCEDPNDQEYHNYGGRGITIYPPWRESFLSFYQYIMETIGERPKNHYLDRIDNDKNYEPGNLRWATGLQQRLNQRRQQNPMRCIYKRDGKHRVRISDRRLSGDQGRSRRVYLGDFKNLEDAIVVRDAVEAICHAEVLR